MTELSIYVPQSFDVKDSVFTPEMYWIGSVSTPLGLKIMKTSTEFLLMFFSYLEAIVSNKNVNIPTSDIQIELNS